MKNIVTSFIFAILFGCMQLFGTIIPAPDLEIFEDYLKNLDNGALVVIDVDDTLLMPNDHILTYSGLAYLRQLMTKFPVNQEEANRLISIVMLESKVSLIDKKMFVLLDILKQKKIKVIALTAMLTGSIGLIENMEEWRIRQLASLGIDLGWSFPELGSIAFKNFGNGEKSPVFKHGILASSCYPKGQVLCAFLNHIQWTPSKILFIDDQIDCIQSVESELDKKNIPHFSFHYTAVADLVHQINQKIADFQVDYLIYKGSWLSDEQAKNELSKDSIKLL